MILSSLVDAEKWLSNGSIGSPAFFVREWNAKSTFLNSDEISSRRSGKFGSASCRSRCSLVNLFVWSDCNKTMKAHYELPISHFHSSIAYIGLKGPVIYATEQNLIGIKEARITKDILSINLDTVPSVIRDSSAVFITGLIFPRVSFSRLPLDACT